MKRVSLGEAVDEVTAYLQGKNMMPYFVLIDGANEYTEFLSCFSSLSIVHTSDFCKEDFLPDYGRLEDELRMTLCDSILIGLGDSVYLGGNASVLGRIKDTCYLHKLIVVCRNVNKEVRILADNDSKFNAYNVCRVDSIGGYVVTQVTDDLAVEVDAVNFSSLLKELEKGRKGEILARSSMTLKSATQISNSYQYIKYRSPSFPIEEKCLRDEQWREFADASLSDDSAYDYMHWRAYLEALHKPSKNSYIRFVMEQSNSAEEYSQNLIYGLLSVPVNHKNFWQLYHDRKNIVSTLREYDFSDYANRTLKMDSERIYYLTDQSEVERKAILEEIIKLGAVPKDIGKLYPAIEAYLHNYAFSGSKGGLFSEYFQKYKLQKLYNNVSEDFKKKVEDLAKTGNRVYVSLPTRGTLLERYDKNRDILFWLDGMGVEFLGYIQQCAKTLGLSIQIAVGRCELPSLTWYNKDFFDSWNEANRKKSRKLDDIKHDGEQIHLNDELAVIDEGLAWIKNRLAEKRNVKVILTSDHGASRLAVLNNRENKWNMATDGEHSGRCCPMNEIDGRPECATEERDFWVLANYDRFRGGRKASVEVHGGAALEEVLIPVIEFSLKDPSIDIENLTPETVSDNVDIVPEIILFSTYELKNVSVYFNNKFYQSIIDEENPHKFHVRFDDYRKSGTYVADVYEADNFIDQIEFTIIRKSGKSEGFEFFGM